MKKLLSLSILVFATLTACVKVDIHTGEHRGDFKYSSNVTIPEGAEVSHDTLITFKVKEPAGEFSFKVSNISGNLKVLKSDRNQIRVILKYKNDAQKYYNVYIYSNSSSASIIVKSKEKWLQLKDNGKIDMIIFVPEGMGCLAISNVNGSIVVMDRIFEGEMSISTVNGDIKGKLKAGSLTLSSVNGYIRAGISADSVNVNNVNGSIKLVLGEFNEVDVNAVNGSISVSIPDNLGITGEANTINGKIHYKELETLPDFRVIGESSHLFWKLKGGNLKFKIGTGEAYLRTSTINGSIRFHLIGGMI